MSRRKKGKASLRRHEANGNNGIHQSAFQVKLDDTFFVVNAYLRLVSSFPKKWITTVLKTKLENTVNKPAIPAERQIEDVFN